MDLPTCPACGQSVIDDDAADCPFCGASMSGPRTHHVKPPQPGAPASAQAAGSPAPATTSSPRSSSSPPSPSARTPSGLRPSSPGAKQQHPADDEPFAVETTAIKTAARASRQRVKGRPLRVVCPMCDTVGYVPRAAAGKEVRCANKECLVPVFTAPIIKKKPVVEEQPESQRSSATLIVSTFALFALAGGAVWFFVLNRGSQPDDASTTGRTDPAGTADASASIEPNASGASGASGADSSDAVQPVEAAQKPLTLEEVKKRVLDAMIVASQEPSQNRSKPYCRQRTARTFADFGDLEGARGQIERLEFVGRNVPFYKVPALVDVAWLERKAGNVDAARKTLDEALQASESLPRFGSTAVRSATMLAIALAAAGRADDAQRTIERYSRDVATARLVAHWSNAYHRRTYDLDAAFAESGLLPSETPLWVAVTNGLVAHGRLDDALQWARRHPDRQERARCLVSWSESVYNELTAENRAELRRHFDAVVDQLKPAGQGVLFARLARRQLESEDRDAAANSLEKANAALDSLEDPVAFVLPGMRELYVLTLPDPIAGQTAAWAAAEIARVQARFGEQEAAAKSLTTALDYLRGTAPSPSAIEKRLNDIDTLGTATIRDQLRDALQLDSTDEADRALRRYRRTCRTILDASKTRFRFQVTLLAAALDWNLLDQVHREIESRREPGDPDQSEPYGKTPLPWMLASRYREAGQTDIADKVEAGFGLDQEAIQHDLPSRVTWLPELLIAHFTVGLADGGNVDQAAAQLRKGRKVGGPVWQERWSLQLACRLVKRGQLEAVFQLGRRFDDDVLREDTYELASALATRRGQGREILKIIDESRPVPTERVAMLRGLVLGLISLKAETRRATPARQQATGTETTAR